MDATRTRTGTNVRRTTTAAAAALAVAVLTIGSSTASAQPSLFAASTQYSCVTNHNVNAFLRANHANVLRLILSPQQGPAGAGLGCIKDAYAAGFKVYISLQFVNSWTPTQVASYFNRVLPTYAPYLWAVGVGNEQDLTSTGTGDQGMRSLAGRGRSVGENYRSDWDAVERILVRRVPHAIRVYGDFSPWAFSAVQQGFAAGTPPGVQAIAVHCYRTRATGGLEQVPQYAAWAASKRLPLWCSEMGPAISKPTTPGWVLRDTWASWEAAVSKIAAKSPDLKMTSYYYFPTL
ncbi:MAG: hypothetical protein JOY58_06915 [Solirubrobacterales bacterium]|nr:hypothetical protein [Solirubrobacterales bacterium]